MPNRLDKLCCFVLEKSFKRMNGDWEVRYTWTLNDGTKDIESPWSGYETAEEAIKAMLEVK